MQITLGSKVRDKITGLTGIVTCVSEWLNGCKRVCVQPQELKDGKPVEASHFDVEQMEVIEAAPLSAPRKTGGPTLSPTRNADAR